MSPCQCIRKVVSGWTPLDHQGEQHLLWCAQSRHWRLGTMDVKDVFSMSWRKSEKAPLLLHVQPQFSSLDFEHFEASCSRYEANWLPGRRSVRQVSDPVTRSPASLGWWWNDGETMVKWLWNDGEMIKHCLVNIFFADVCSSDLLCILSFGRDLLPRLATAADSCAEAFKSWRSTPVSSRARVMFLQLQIQLGEGKESNKEPKGFIGKVSLELSERGLLQKCK